MVTGGLYFLYFAEVSVIVKKSHDCMFIESGWEVMSQSTTDTTFKFVCPNSYIGDDESIVYSIWSELPTDCLPEYFEIDWENSVY